MKRDLPILEYDPTRKAILEPGELIKHQGLPPRCVLCFFQEVLDGLIAEGRLRKISNSRSEIGEHPFFALRVDDQEITVLHPGVGAPLAAALLEEAIAKGCRAFIACGGAGTLDSELTVGHIVVPIAAVRHEGTSYHYLPPAREVQASAEAVQAIESVLERHRIPYLIGKTWTTDGFYRETPRLVARRRAEGCLTVEMEAAAFFAVARFRGVTFGQILYAGDDVSGDVWDSRNWETQHSVREQLFWLAVESCLALS